MGCPTGISYPPGDAGKEKIDPSLLGTWHNMTTDSGEMSEIILRKTDAYSLHATVVKQGPNYSLDQTELHAWCTEIDGKKFVYFQPAAGSDTNYYNYCYRVFDDHLETYDVSLLINGVDGVTSTETYRNEIAGSIKLPKGLSDTLVWKKM